MTFTSAAATARCHGQCGTCGRQLSVVQRESGQPPSPGAVERGLVLAKMGLGLRDPGKLTNEVFFLRHPARRGTRIEKHERALAEEWSQIRARVVLPLVLAGPAEGPLHGAPRGHAGSRLFKVPAGAVLSPLAIAPRGLRAASAKLSKVAQIVVHTTSRGPVGRAAKGGYRRAAVEFAIDYYVGGDGGYPHYVIDFNGTIYATADERYQSWHAGWVHAGGAKHFVTNWTAPRWWSAVWSRFGARTPLNLLPKGATHPNAQSIGVELMILPDLAYTDAQYVALARLIRDIQRRYALEIPAAPSKQLLGHEDYAPLTLEGGRANAGGGWDPGAHRTNPYFSWSRVWSEMKKI
jgi:hypothetical protein